MGINMTDKGDKDRMEIKREQEIKGQIRSKEVKLVKRERSMAEVSIYKVK